MEERRRTDFCTECRRETEYSLQKRSLTKTIRGVKHTFRLTAAICSECGGEMEVPGLIDKNIQEFEEQYRAQHS